MVSSAAPPVVELIDVSKSFDSTAVLHDLTLRVPGGQIYGLIGPSGCGKTTTIRLLVGVLAPSAGDVRVMGVRPADFTARHRERIGYTPQGFYLYPTLTVMENVRFVAGLYGVPWFKRGRRVREVLTFLELWDARKRMARDISGGMQRRLSLACALVHDPVLLFVDEPTAGLDPVLREKIWGLLRRLRDEGRTIFVSTQYIDEAVYCDTVAVMNEGTLAAIGTPDELRRMAIGGEVLDVEAEEPFRRDHLVALWQLDGVQMIEPHGPRLIRLTVDDVTTCTPAVTEVLQQRGVDVAAVRPYVPTFDEVFLAIVSDGATAPNVAANGRGKDRERVHQHV
jgi:ABC-2 type transport system ATP-binding protein